VDDNRGACRPIDPRTERGEQVRATSPQDRSNVTRSPRRRQDRGRDGSGDRYRERDRGRLGGDRRVGDAQCQGGMAGVGEPMDGAKAQLLSPPSDRQPVAAELRVARAAIDATTSVDLARAAPRLAVRKPTEDHPSPTAVRHCCTGRARSLPVHSRRTLNCVDVLVAYSPPITPLG
jgi:hypothetical protein